MKYIIKNPTEEQIKSLKKLGLCVFYSESEGIHFIEVPEISEEDLPEGVVDLSLPSGLKWSSCNIGANSPCESGLLFQFGRVDGYAYGDDNNQFRTPEQNKADTGNYYLPRTTSGKTYATGAILDPADDAVYVATNGTMRMPTVAEIDELLANTTNEWCQCNIFGKHTNHSIYGRLFTSKIDESKKIFIPAAGSFSGVSFDFTGSMGFIWSSSVTTDDADFGHSLSFESGYCHRYDEIRSNGFPVRGVCK